MPAPTHRGAAREELPFLPGRWEYKTLKLRATGFFGGNVDDAQLDRAMNDLGQQGWELTTAFDTNEGHGSTRDIVVLFKRPAA